MDYDVVIVTRTGSGPRWRPGSVRPATESACFERHGTLFGLPRAIRFDGEAMSLFQNLGIGEEIEHDIVPAANYVWYGTDEPPVVDWKPTGSTPSCVFSWHRTRVPRLRGALAGCRCRRRSPCHRASDPPQPSSTMRKG